MKSRKDKKRTGNQTIMKHEKKKNKKMMTFGIG